MNIPSFHEDLVIAIHCEATTRKDPRRVVKGVRAGISKIILRAKTSWFQALCDVQEAPESSQNGGPLPGASQKTSY